MFEYDIGFLGGGQLARMSIQAAQRMGLRCLSLDPGEDTPAGQMADSVVGSLSDPAAIRHVFEKCERVTLENEFIPADQIRVALGLSHRNADCLLPGYGELRVIQNKWVQNKAYEQHGVPSPRSIRLGHLKPGAAVDELITKFGLPLVVKSCFGGYDGKGTRTIQNENELREFLEEYDLEKAEGYKPHASPLEQYQSHRAADEWLAEEFVPFKRELAVMVYRSKDEVGTFPTMESVQTDHVCDLVFPAGVDASEIAIHAVEAVEGYGLFGVELFELEDGSFQVNEIAPRPHNTGHYSLDWGGVSQFEQHIRLVMRWPCAKPEGQPTCMANLLGQPGAGDYKEGLAAALQGDTNVHVHWYGKAESRPGRKMGHINVVGDDCVHRAKAARERFYRGWTGV